MFSAKILEVLAMKRHVCVLTVPVTEVLLMRGIQV